MSETERLTQIICESKAEQVENEITCQMDANQRVKYRKLIGYLSPYDSQRINNPHYSELKEWSHHQEELSNSQQESSRFIMRQLGSPIRQRAKPSLPEIVVPLNNVRVKLHAINGNGPRFESIQSANRNITNKSSHNRSASVLQNKYHSLAQVKYIGVGSASQQASIHQLPSPQKILNFSMQVSNNSSRMDANINNLQVKKSIIALPTHHHYSSSQNNLKSKTELAENNTLVELINQKRVMRNVKSLQILANIDNAPKQSENSLIENTSKWHDNSLTDNTFKLNEKSLTENTSKQQENSLVESTEQKGHDTSNIISKQVIFQEHVQYAWSELKFKGKLCEGRSFSPPIIFNNLFYFYGGYDANKGVQQDFISLHVSDRGPSSFQTVELSPENKLTPGKFPNNYPSQFFQKLTGRLCRHGVILRCEKMIIFGGKSSSIESTNKMYEYSFMDRVFNSMTPSLEGENKFMPAIDSHSLVYDEKQDVMVAFGGFLGDECSYSNKIYYYSFQHSLWKLIEPISPPEKRPSPRGSHASILKNSKLYIYGGSDGDNILSDFWHFDLLAHTWTQIDTSSHPVQPGPRSGVMMIDYEDNFFMFGGFKSLINERNDLIIFSCAKGEWVYQSESIEVEDPLHDSLFPINKEGLSLSHLTKRGVKNETPHQNNQKQRQFHPLMLSDDVNQIIIRNRGGKKKINEEKKMELLKQFDVSQDMLRLLIQPTPILQSMKSTLHMLSSCNKSHLFDFINQKQLQSQHIQNTDSKIRGKHPGARDGYLCGVLGNKLIVFGGDRHRMSLNDAYELDLPLLINYLKNL